MMLLNSISDMTDSGLLRSIVLCTKFGANTVAKLDAFICREKCNIGIGHGEHALFILLHMPGTELRLVEYRKN